MNDHTIRVQLLGPETTSETQYGPRSNRETLATVEVDVNAYLGFDLVAHVLAEVSPQPANTEENREYGVRP